MKYGIPKKLFFLRKNDSVIYFRSCKNRSQRDVNKVVMKRETQRVWERERKKENEDEPIKEIWMRKNEVKRGWERERERERKR
jgi:hypothetical protein